MDRERLLQVTQAAASWFEAEFDAGNRRAGQVREYLARRIGGPAKVEWARQRGFRLGYAPGHGWTDLTDHLRTQGFTDEDLINAGVATRSSRGNLVDRFRQRLMFGIHDTDGHLAGFIGRTMSAGQEPKYLNNPASVLFDKGQLLFGWWEQRDLTSRADPLFVEGPIDVLAVAASDDAGLRMPIASCGTALTAAHLDVHPCLPANGANNPRTYARARRRGSTPQKPPRHTPEQPIQATGPRLKIRIHHHKID